MVYPHPDDPHVFLLPIPDEELVIMEDQSDWIAEQLRLPNPKFESEIRVNAMVRAYAAAALRERIGEWLKERQVAYGVVPHLLPHPKPKKGELPRCAAIRIAGKREAIMFRMAFYRPDEQVA